LWNWIIDGLGWYGFDYGDDRRIRKVAAALQIPVAEQGASGVIDHLEIRCRADPGFLLDVVQAMLKLYGRDRERAFVLAELLNRAGSAYAVRPGWDGLELRLTPGEGTSSRRPRTARQARGVGP
jgi:hypothetical protein